MFEIVDFMPKEATKEDKKRYKALINRLVLLQQQARQAGVGVVVLFEGWNGAGKGTRISDLMYNLDARATSVYVTPDTVPSDVKNFPGRKHGVHDFSPVMAEFWRALGMRDSITFYDRGWYTRALERMRLGDDPHIYSASILSFEKQLVDDGYIVLKFFVHVSKQYQKATLKRLHDNPKTAWRVSDADLKSCKRYDEDYERLDKLLDMSSFPFAPWVVLNGEDPLGANITIANNLVNALEQRLNQGIDAAAAEAAAKAEANSAGKLKENTPQLTEEEKLAEAQAQADTAQKLAPLNSRFAILQDYPRLQDVDYTLSLEYEDYKQLLKQEQERFADLEMEMYQRRIPLMIVYEGQDAAGKGGNIKRVAQALDARSYTIFPSPAPTKPELMHPFLWRYWTRLPKAGHVGIYDRSWYGRVLVERVEGFASPAEWGRAYDEINEFEQTMLSWGAILLKFWVEIDSNEQLARFKARQEDPQKQWKITDEDWRNREKAPQYHAAIQDMLRLTSTSACPWHILESNNKLYARIKALKIINQALEDRMK